LKYLLKEQSWNEYLELIIYVLAGGLTYIVIIELTARKLSQQVLELINSLLPKSRFWKIS